MWKEIAMSYFEQFIIQSSKYTGIVLADFSKPSTHELYTILALYRWYMGIK